MTFKICVISRKKFVGYSNDEEKKFRLGDSDRESMGVDSCVLKVLELMRG